MFTASVADSLMPRSSDQRPDCGASIRTIHLSPPICSANAVTGAMPLSGLASVTDTPWAVVSFSSSLAVRPSGYVLRSGCWALDLEVDDGAHRL